MFKKLEVLDTKIHKDLTYAGVAGYKFAQQIGSAPIAFHEVFQASKFFPVLFPNEGRLLPIALLALSRDKTSFVASDGTWKAGYIPAQIRRYPFILGESDSKSGKYVVMVDVEAPQFAQEGGQPLFVDGKPQEDGIVEKARKFLVDFQLKLQQTEQLLKPLETKEVLVRKQFRIKKPDGSERVTQTFRQVDEDKLARLNDKTLAAWARSGLLSIVTMHLNSLQNAQEILKLEDDLNAI